MRPKTHPTRIERFGNNLRAALKERGIRQNQLAAAVDLSPQAIGHYLGKRCLPSYEMALRIAKHLKTDLIELGWY